MKNKILMIFIMFLLPVSFGSGQKISSEELMKELPKIDSIECKFKQEKNIKNLQRPLLSEGNFRFVKGEGVYFETLYPIKSTVSYTNKEYKQINDIILAISNKKYSKIDREFDFFLSKNGNVWELELKPKTGSRSEKYLETLNIEGEKYINKIIITAKDGSRTTQWFLVE